MLTLDDLDWFTTGMRADVIEIPAEDWNRIRFAYGNPITAPWERPRMWCNGVEIVKGKH